MVLTVLEEVDSELMLQRGMVVETEVEVGGSSQQ
jgi:hypothetical protein